MFKHGMTGKTYFSVREKLRYYRDIVAGKITDVPTATKRKAKLRIRSLERIDRQSYDSPTLIVTDDRHFGNGISKPRLCAVVGVDKKNRIMVAPLQKRTTRAIILDHYPDRQIDQTVRLLDRSDVYETKYVSNVKSLTRYDKVKIRNCYKKSP